jgi:hypothetical protein
MSSIGMLLPSRYVISMMLIVSQMITKITADPYFLWLISSYMAVIQDKLMEHPVQPWFSSLVSIEVIFQLPFFFLAIYAILQQPKHSHNRAIRGDGPFKSLCIIYGSSTATTLVPILQCILTNEETYMSEKGILLGFYLPYLIFPVWLVLIAVCNDDIFGGVDGIKKEQ